MALGTRAASTASRATPASARRSPTERAAAAGLALLLLAAAFLFGGVYLWSALILAAALAVATALVLGSRPRRAPAAAATARPALRILDLGLAALLAGVLLQAVPLPASVVHAISPAREAFLFTTSLQPAAQNVFVPLTLDVAATLHAWLSLFCTIVTFWLARAVFARGGIRTFSALLAWGAIVIAVLAFAQHASGTILVYGFWRPRDLGARPLGPFVNRNHLGTWSIMAICVCAGYLQWRSANSRKAASWRTALARWLDGRRLMMQLAVVLLAATVALGASRSALVALACAAGYVALAAPSDPQAAQGRSTPFSRRGGRRRLSLAALAGFAVIGMLGYGDGQQWLQRMDETRTVGMANRLAIWQDAVPVVLDFPLAGVGAGAFATAMRVYQTSPRTYYHNEAHNQYLQLMVEGGVLLLTPAAVALLAFVASAWRQLRRRDDPIRWMRVAAAGGLIGAAVQSIWETGLTLPANGMLAATLAALLVHASAPTSGLVTPTEEQR